MSLSLSTSWVGADHPTVEDTIREAYWLGFTRFEIGAAGDMPPAERLKSLGRELGLTYTSVHNIAYREGLPHDEVRGDGLSSTDSVVRRRAIDKTLETIDLARALSAGYVVIHAGDVDVEKGSDKQHAARRLIEKGRTREAHEMMRRHMAERNAIAARNVELAAASLSEVFERSGDFPLALECRVHYYSIPLPGEMEFLCTILGRHAVRYCHDTGHARVAQMLGLAPSETWLERFGDILGGLHLHDVRGMEDHRIPGDGEVDFESLARFVKEDTVRVIELHDEISRKGLVQAARRIEEAGLG